MKASRTIVDLQAVGAAGLPALLLIADYHAFEGVSGTAAEHEAAARERYVLMSTPVGDG